MDKSSVLIVEDERIIAFDLQDQLQRLGYHVLDVVSNGEDALQRAAQLRPAIVLMDIFIEGEIDGIDTARQVYGRFRIPVVFLTAFSGDNLVQRATTALPFGYLTKPFDTRELHATLQVALARSVAQAALEHTEERLRLALQAAELLVWEREVAAGTLAIDSARPDAFGGFLAAPLDTWQKLLDRIHPDDRTLLTARAQGALTHGAQFEVVLRTTDESSRCVELFAKTFAVPEGTAPRMIGVLRDVTDRQRAQEKLRQASVVYETIVEAIMILDHEGSIVSVNPAFTTLTGYDLEEVAGRNAAQLLQARRHTDAMSTYLREAVDRQWHGQIHCRRKDGTVVPVWQSVGTAGEKSDVAKYHVVALTDITALRKAEDELRHLSRHDPLTGLPNRLHLKDLMNLALERSRDGKGQCAVVFVDLDGFKTINDTLGHAAGDTLLQGIAGRLRSELRRSDIAARLGGDEFVVVLGDVPSKEEAARLVTKILESVSRPIRLGAQSLTVSASAGIALFPRDGEDADALLRASDLAMYRAKARGRDKVAFYAHEFQSAPVDRLAVEQGLRRAVAQGEFELHYQPIVSLRDGTLTGLETLLRWRQGGDTLVTPDQFIGVAESTGLIDPIGHWVFLNACLHASKWIKSGSAMRLTINVSPRQLAIADVPFQIREALHRSRFPPQNLELEITESALHANEGNSYQLEELRRLGVSITIDDFGTGYSSLSTLQQLPVDRIKIDQSFIKGVASNGHDYAIVQAICDMCQTLGMRVVAEGVETIDQLARLQKIDCHEVQGFLFSKAVAVESVNDLMRRESEWQALLSGSVP